MNTLYVVASGAQQRAIRLPAAQLYTGALFSAAITHARRFAKAEHSVRILSLEHGLLNQTQLVQPYKARLGPLDVQTRTGLTAAIRRDLPRTGTLPLRVVVLAPDEYISLFRSACAGTRFENVPLRAPLAHLNFDQQIQWLQAAQWPVECHVEWPASESLYPSEDEQVKAAVREAALWWAKQLMRDAPPPEPSLFAKALALELRRTWEEVVSMSRGEWPEDVSFPVTCQQAEGPVAKAFEAIGLSPREWWKREWRGRPLDALMHFSLASVSVQSKNSDQSQTIFPMAATQTSRAP